MDAGEPVVARTRETIAGEVFLDALQRHGVEYFFANAGTDFPPIIEGLARAAERGRKVPRPIVVPHENAAVAMAHGVYMVSGRPQAVMVHVNVGTGNTLNTLINASRDFVPLLLLAGRSPITETGKHGSRNRYIHWAQEMFDQAGMVREIVKWDYELRIPDHVGDAVDRAFEVMMTAPRGPVYLTLPREILGAAAKPLDAARARRALPEAPHPSPEAIATLAQWIAAAARPLIITANAGRNAREIELLGRVAERFALPVVSFNRRFLCLPSSHPMHLGYQPRPLLDEADLVIVLDCDVPWFPSLEGPPPGCRIVHIGEDPAFIRYPIRSFPADLSITASTAPALAALEAALARAVPAEDVRVQARRERLTRRSAELRAKWAAEGKAKGEGEAIGPEWLSHVIGEAVGPEAIVVNEYPLRPEYCPRERPGTYFGLSPAGGLGWGFGAALGAKLAAPDRLVVATLGDGAYVFANPTACHWVAAAHDLPILTIVFNNALYGGVRNATLSMYGSGVAARDGGKLLADLEPSPAFEKVVEASGGVGIRVEKPAELRSALVRALEVVTKEKRQALVNVICRY